MESRGERLKKIRLEKGISLEEAHKKTKIHPDVLKAIEEDSLINFNPVYIKGFLKIYCKFLGENPNDYITDYKEPRAKFEPAASIEKKAFSKFKRPELNLDFLKSIDLKIIKKVLVFVFIFAFVVVLFNLGRSFSLRRVFSGSKKSPLAAEVKAEKKSEAKAQKTRVAAPIKPQPQESEPAIKKSASAVSGVRLTIRARDNCWIQLKSDGKVIFQGILMKGRTEGWQAKERIELSLGNAGVVELQANEKFFSSLGKKGQAIKNIVITREGLTIGR